MYTLDMLNFKKYKDMKKIVIALFCLFAVAGTVKATIGFDNSVIEDDHSSQKIEEVKRVGYEHGRTGVRKFNEYSCKLDFFLFRYYDRAYEKGREEKGGGSNPNPNPFPPQPIPQD